MSGGVIVSAAWVTVAPETISAKKVPSLLAGVAAVKVSGLELGLPVNSRMIGRLRLNLPVTVALVKLASVSVAGR